MIELNKFWKQIHSQSGEDGILQKIFEELGIENGWFCEFGAGDGENISNTRIFRENGWSGVLIEGDEERFDQLFSKKIVDGEKVYAIKKYISCEPGEKIDEILSKTPIPRNFDLISIDVDGNDLWIWKSMEKYRPKVVIIEYNSHFSVEESRTIKYDKDHRFSNDRYYGASAGALLKLASEKNYDLVAYTDGLNLIFVDSDFSGKFSKIDKDSIGIKIGWPPSNREMDFY